MSALEYEFTLRKLEGERERVCSRDGVERGMDRPALPAWNAVWSWCVRGYAWSAAHLHPRKAPTG